MERELHRLQIDHLHGIIPVSIFIANSTPMMTVFCGKWNPLKPYCESIGKFTASSSFSFAFIIAATGPKISFEQLAYHSLHF